MRIILCFLVVLTGFAEINAREIEKAGVEKIQKILNNPEDKLFVLNFWASWCRPCVKELSYFEKLAKEYSYEEVEFILMSLDFPSQIESRLIPFLKRNEISLKVILIEELDYDKWMNLVDESWQGNLPATLFINNKTGLRHFVNRPLEEDELRNVVNTMIPPPIP